MLKFIKLSSINKVEITRPFLIAFLYVTLIIFFFIYRWNPQNWSRAYVGDMQYGDAEFWWNGVIHYTKAWFNFNPAKGFRPGYFIFTAPFATFVNGDFNQYYHLFLIIFLFAVYKLNLSLQLFFSRISSNLISLYLLFSPYVSEWLATSTTDATGLLLVLFSLSYLIRYFKYFKVIDLIMFGIFFSFQSLTRPLLSPLVLVISFLLIINFYTFSNLTFKRRFYHILILFLSFGTLNLSWGFIQKLTINEFSTSQNDASAFYAASDPDIQTWNDNMEKPIVAKMQLERKEFKTRPVTLIDLNHELWRLTIDNYKKHFIYHAKRIPFHIKALLKFDYDLASLNTSISIKKLLILSSFICFIVAYKIFTLQLLLIILSIVLFPPNIISYVFFVFFIYLLYKVKDFFLACIPILAFFITAIVSTYLIGATQAPGASTKALISTELTGLGYRLSTQYSFLFIFFVILSIERYFFIVLKIKSPQSVSDIPFIQTFKHFSRCISLFFVLFWVAGCAKIYKNYLNNNGRIIEEISEETINNFKDQVASRGYRATNAKLVSGMFSYFSWKLSDQDRKAYLFYPQKTLLSNRNNNSALYLDSASQSDLPIIDKTILLWVKDFTPNINSAISTLPIVNYFPSILAYQTLDSNNPKINEKLIEVPLTLDIIQLLKLDIIYAINSHVEVLLKNIGGRNTYRQFQLMLNHGDKDNDFKFVLKTKLIKQLKEIRIVSTKPLEISSTNSKISRNGHIYSITPIHGTDDILLSFRNASETLLLNDFRIFARDLN